MRHIIEKAKKTQHWLKDRIELRRGLCSTIFGCSARFFGRQSNKETTHRLYVRAKAGKLCGEGYSGLGGKAHAGRTRYAAIRQLFPTLKGEVFLKLKHGHYLCK
jgi:hypothetical protein